MSSAYTPEGFRNDFMRNAVGGMVGGSASTFTKLICPSAKYDVYECHTDAGIAYVYPVTFSEAELLSVMPNIEITPEIRKHLVPLSQNEISQIVQSISQADKASEIIAMLSKQHMRLMIVTDSMLTSKGALEVIFGDHSLRLIFLRAIIEGASVVQAENDLLEAITSVFGDAEATKVAEQPTGGRDVVASPIYNLDDSEDDIYYQQQHGGHHNKDFLELIFQSKGLRKPAVLLQESSMLDDIDALKIRFADPLVSTAILQYIGFITINGDMYVCPDSSTLSAYIPQVGNLSDPIKAHRVIQVLVNSANRYGGAKLFRNVRSRLRDAGQLPAWIKMELPPRTELMGMVSEKQLTGIRDALVEKLNEATAHSITILNNPAPPNGIFGVPLLQAGGSRWTFKYMADVWDNLLHIRKKELQQINKKLSDHSWQQIVNKVQEYRNIETQLSTIEAVLAQYRATALSTDPEEIDDVATLTKLVNKQNELETRKLKNVVRINDIFKTLFDTHYTTPPAAPQAAT